MKKLDKFKLIKKTDDHKIGKIFDGYDGLVCGAILKINGKDMKIYFNDKEYFQLVEKC